MRRMRKYNGDNYMFHLLKDKNFRYFLKEKKENGPASTTNNQSFSGRK